jgi:nucleoside-diphosphate-sugar epimerase
LPRREGEIRHSLGDPSATAKAIGFEAQTSLLDGLARTIRAATPEPAYAAK